MAKKSKPRGTGSGQNSMGLTREENIKLARESQLSETIRVFVRKTIALALGISPEEVSPNMEVPNGLRRLVMRYVNNEFGTKIAAGTVPRMTLNTVVKILCAH